MAELFDLQDEDKGNASNITNPSEFTDPVEQTAGQPDETPSTPPEEPSLPEKYRGKSVEEIVRMHQEAEKLIGKQAQEVGEVRKLADELIKQQLEKKHDVQQTPKAQEIDFFEDPAKAVNQVVENNPILKDLQSFAETQRQQAALLAVEKAHPDFVSVVNSEDFLNWVKSSKVRLQLFAQANNYDSEAGIELLDTFKSIKAVRETTTKAADESLKKADEESRTKALQAAAVQKGGSGETSKPVYRRADLIRLKMEDPARYEAMAEDILAAYAEGRVK